MISLLYHSSCLTSFTTCSLGDIVARGDSIRVLFGGIAENLPLRRDHNALIGFHACGDSSGNNGSGSTMVRRMLMAQVLLVLLHG